MKKIILLSSFFFLSIQLFASELERASRSSSSFTTDSSVDNSSGWDDEAISSQLPDFDFESKNFPDVASPVFVPSWKEQQAALVAYAKQKEALQEQCDRELQYEEARQEKVLSFAGEVTSTGKGIARNSMAGGGAFALVGTVAGMIICPFAGAAAYTALALIGGGAAVGAATGVALGNVDLYTNTVAYRSRVSARIKSFTSIKSELELLFESLSENDYSKLGNVKKDVTKLEQQLAELKRTREIIGSKKNADGTIERFFLPTE